MKTGIVPRMDADRRSAVLTGTFYILGTVVGIVGLGAVLGPLLGAQDYLTAYGTMETRVLVASLLELFMAASLVAMAASVYQVLWKHNPAAAAAYLGIRLLEAVPVIIGVISMLALSRLGQDYLVAGASDLSRYATLGAILHAVPEWSGHIILDVAIFPFGACVFYWILFRARLVPRWLPLWGFAGALLYWAAGVLIMFRVLEPLSSPHMLLQAPLGLQEMVLAVWLIAKGFRKPTAAAGV